MPKSNRRVFQIARLSGCSSAEALRILNKLGYGVLSENDLVAKDQKTKALSVVQDTVAKRKEAELAEAKRKTKEVRAKKLQNQKTNNSIIIGHRTDEMSYLNTDEVIDIHWRLVKDFEKSRDPIEPPGVRSKDLLASAIFRVFTSLDDELKYPSVPMAGAAYLHAIISNHAFYNGNKRTALVSTLVFLDMNNYLLDIDDEDELFEFILRVASHNIVNVKNTNILADEEMNEIARWLQRSIRPISKQENILKFRELKSILREFNCNIKTTARGSSINITRGDLHTQIHYRNDGTDVNRNTVRRIRKALYLMDENGYDSIIFYNKGRRIPEFIRKYRRTLELLAKV